MAVVNNISKASTVKGKAGLYMSPCMGYCLHDGSCMSLVLQNEFGSDQNAKSRPGSVPRLPIVSYTGG